MTEPWLGATPIDCTTRVFPSTSVSLFKTGMVTAASSATTIESSVATGASLTGSTVTTTTAVVEIRPSDTV